MPEIEQQNQDSKPSGMVALRMMVKRLTDVDQSEFPNRLVTPYREEDKPVQEKWILLTLFFLALVPRLVMLNFSNGASDDSYYYIHIARILGEGDFSYRGAFYYLGLNVYPAILLTLHWLGLDWHHGGMIWGVTISALTVLPIYGWVKRLFDYRVGMTAAFLFSVNPDLIEYSIDPIREPTYWFFVSLFLYFSLRALTEMKPWLYLCLGLTFCLAIHTRSESWILLVPLGIWYLLQFFSSRVSKLRLIHGLILMVLVTPLMLLAVNLTVLRNEENWQIGRLYYFKVVASYLLPEKEDKAEILVAKKNTFPIKKMVNAPTTVSPVKNKNARQVTAKKEVTPPTKSTKPVSKPDKKKVAKKVQAKPVSSPKTTPVVVVTPQKKTTDKKSMLPIYFKSLMRTHEPLLSVLHLIGIIFFFRQLFLQLDKIPLALYYIALLTAIWLRTDTSQNINGRYFHSLFYMTVPYQALGLLVVCKTIGRFRLPDLDSVKANQAWKEYRLVPVLCFVGAITLFYWGDAFTSHHQKREQQVELGLWLKKNIPDVKTVLVDRNSTRIGYYAQGSSPQANYHHVLFSDLIQKTPPDLVILSLDKVSKYFQQNTTELVKPLGLEPVDTSLLLPYARNYLILAKQPPRSTMNIAGESNASSIH